MDFADYATKSDLKSATGVDTSKFVDLASLKSDFDDLDIDKLKTVPDNLYKLSNVAEEEVCKETAYDELVKKVTTIQTTDNSALVKKLSITQQSMKLKKNTKL